MSKRPGKSIIASFGAFSAPPAPAASPEPPADEPAPAEPRGGSRVGAGIIGATQRSLSEIREERDRLQAIVAKGGGLELDPDIIDPSPFPDRLPDDGDEVFEAFTRTIAEEGQKVPIQVRRAPDRPGRYQVVYGHRRWRACRVLGRPVKAIVTDLTDGELVVAQGIENAVRQDLSWIERALFVWRMDEAGVRPRDIKAALAIDDAELARLRSVPRSVPVDVIESIGRAPKAGRPRWTALAAALARDPRSLPRLRAALSADKVASSDERFRRALAAVTEPPAAAFGPLAVGDPAGRVKARAVFGRGEVRLKIETGDGEAFADFMRAELPGLMERFALRSGKD